MIAPGPAPSPDQIEISLFGPSYGEAIAVHLGGGDWMLVDSCLHPDTNGPITAAYLDQLGVMPEQVKAIVASHWHDDHVAGLAALVSRYKSAELFIPNYFAQKEGAAYLAAFSGTQAPQARGTRELYLAAMESNPVPTGHRVEVYRQGAGSLGAVHVAALSPVPAAWGQAMAALFSGLPSVSKQIGHAVLPKTNIASVVIHVQFGSDAVLLGSDLEKHANLGWQAVIASNFAKSRQRASLYKVAHHGSETGDLAEIWSQLLSQKPVAALTPYVNGRSRLPEAADVARIKGLAGSVHITSTGSIKPKMSAQSERLLKAVGKNVRVLNRPMGHWRFRTGIAGNGPWAAECAGAAQVL